MKRKYFISWFAVSLFFIVECGTSGHQWDEQINMGAYWHTELAFDAGTQQRVEFEIHEGGAVDILFMDQDGFVEFQNRIGRDTVNEQTFDLPIETYGEYHMYVEKHDEYEFTFSWGPAPDTITPAPVDVYVMNYNNFLLYQSLQTFDYYYRYDSTMGVNDIAVITATEDLYFVIDNTSDHGAPPTGEAIYDFTISPTRLDALNLPLQVTTIRSEGVPRLYSTYIPIAFVVGAIIIIVIRAMLDRH